MFGISMVMMPSTTLGLNQLPKNLIPHGTAMHNTFRQIAGSVGTAILVTVMSTAAIQDGTVEGTITGVHIAFLVAGWIVLIGFVLSFKVNDLKNKQVVMTKGK